MNELSTLVEADTSELIVLGFHAKSPELPAWYDSKGNEIFRKDFGSTSQLLRFLESNGSEIMPYGVICNLDYLSAENFKLVKSLKKRKETACIPIIAITHDLKSIDAVEMIKMGLDDVFSAPFKWSDVRRRLEFLNIHKEGLLAMENIPQENLNPKISVFKRAFDIAFASAVLLVLSPLLLIIAILIKLESPGPIIYKSKRVGTGYSVFNFLKFRSMCQNADAKLAQLAHLNHYGDSENTQFVKLNNDPRITSVGKIIRKTSIDELPQLFNVLKGEMSIVGNRPLPLYEAEQMTKDNWAKRFLAPAGLTGLWQVCKEGKDNLTVEQRVGLDVKYAETNNFLLDIKIISQTLPAMIQKES